MKNEYHEPEMLEERPLTIDELIDLVVYGESIDDIIEDAWKKKTPSQLRHIAKLRKRRKHKRPDPKRSRVMKKAMKKAFKSPAVRRKAAMRRAKYR